MFHSVCHENLKFWFIILKNIYNEKFKNWRTPTYDWLQDQLPLPDTFLDISLPDEDIETGPIKDFYVIPKEKITSFLCYEKLSYDENLLETAENVCDEVSELFSLW